MTEIQKHLFSLRDEDYRAFHCRLIPTIDPSTVIGVRTPQLRDYGKQLWRSGDQTAFLSALPHTYYEENNLHGVLICQGKDFPALIRALDCFLPYVDNWATCDSLRPKLFQKHRDDALPHIRRWLASGHTYTIRFGMEALMTYYLDAAFCEDYPAMVAAIRSDEYYVNMMIAWYFATALAKQYPAALPYLETRRLSPWVHNKTIQKAIESDRITQEQKQYLKTLKLPRIIE